MLQGKEDDLNLIEEFNKIKNKNKIIEISYELIENNKDKDTNWKDLIEKIIGEGYVNQYTVDCIYLIEYITFLILI